MSEMEWRDWQFDECPRCGDANARLRTEVCTEPNYANQYDEVECKTCGLPGRIDIDDEDDEDDGNLIAKTWWSDDPVDWAKDKRQITDSR